MWNYRWKPWRDGVYLNDADRKRFFEAPDDDASLIRLYFSVTMTATSFCRGAALAINLASPSNLACSDILALDYVSKERRLKS